jgi:acyl-coenzyme A thioesterase PaaI-like protein
VYLNDLLDARAEVIHAGKRLFVCGEKIVNQNGALLAKGTGTFKSYPEENAR